MWGVSFVSCPALVAMAMASYVAGLVAMAMASYVAGSPVPLPLPPGPPVWLDEFCLVAL